MDEEKKMEVSPFGNMLVYKKEYNPKFIYETIKEYKLNGLRIFVQLKEDYLNDIEFLRECSFLKALDITSYEDYNLDFLTSFNDLKFLSLNIIGKNNIDLKNQGNLKDLSILWRKGKIKGIDKCQNLKKLCLIDFNENDFSAIKDLLSLEILHIKTASVITLEGLENLLSLKEIRLGNCKNLKFIKAIVNNNNLRSINIEHCQNIKDYEYLSELKNLEILQINDCKEIKSISFIQDMSSLKNLVLLGNTKIVDGNLKPALKIEKVIYTPYKFYNVKISNEQTDNMMKQNQNKAREFLKKNL